MKKTLKTLLGPWGILSALVALLSLSKRARKITRDSIVKGTGAAIDYGQQLKGQRASTSKKKSESNKNENQQENYPSYIGYGTSHELNEQTNKVQNIRKVNPTRYKNAKNVMNDDSMPSKMAEIAEEFELFDKE